MYRASGVRTGLTQLACEEAATDDFFSLVAELAEPLPAESDDEDDEDDEDVLEPLSDADPLDPAAAVSFAAGTVLDPFRLSVR